MEIEAVGEKDANLRYYNLDEPLKEAQWVAGVVSQAFGRKVSLLFLPCSTLHMALLSPCDVRAVL